MILFTPAVSGLVLQTANELEWQQQAIALYNQLIKQGDTQLAADWKAFYPAFHRQHPTWTVRQVLSAFVAEELAHGTGKAITQVGGLVGTTVPNALGQAGEKAVLNNPLDFLKYPADFFYRLTEASTWVRVAEFAIGIGLIYVGVKAAVSPGGISRSARSAGTTGGAVVKTLRKGVSKATPTGRAAVTVTRHERRIRAGRTRRYAERIRTQQKKYTRGGRRRAYQSGQMNVRRGP